jgi:hypothetical protein
MSVCVAVAWVCAECEFRAVSVRMWVSEEGGGACEWVSIMRAVGNVGEQWMREWRNERVDDMSVYMTELRVLM